MTLPPLSFKCTKVEPGEIDLEIHAAFVEYLIVPTGMERLKRVLAEQTATIEGIRRAVEEYPNKDERAVGTMAPLSPNLFAIRHWTGLQKADQVREWVIYDLEQNRYSRVVIFCMCRDVIVHLQTTFNRKRNKIRACTLFPGTEPERAKRSLARFKDVAKYRVMVCDVEAAVPGVDLTPADHVIFLEYSWDPMVNAQALMRVHNGAQTKPVDVEFMRLPSGWEHKTAAAVMRATRRIIQPDYDKSVDVISTPDKMDAPQGENPA